MAENPNPQGKIIPRSGGFFQDLTNRFRLISRLLMDSRVNPLVKLLPVASLVYVVWPIDLLPVNPVDDAVVLWLGTTLFVELCPPEVVQEHLQMLNRRAAPGSWQDVTSSPPEGDVIDGEYYDSGSKPPK
jgi:uncharacterized membrane protein YkvA (DUF1232 family)